MPPPCGPGGRHEKAGREKAGPEKAPRRAWNGGAGELRIKRVRRAASRLPGTAEFQRAAGKLGVIGRPARTVNILVLVADRLQQVEIAFQAAGGLVPAGDNLPP